jgi:hypothetical protein
MGEFERPLEVTPELTGWPYPSARAYRYREGQVIDGGSEGDEMVMVVMCGDIIMTAADGVEGRMVRRDPFTEPAVALYLAPGEQYAADVRSDSYVVYCRAPRVEGAIARPTRILAARREQVIGPDDAESLRVTERTTAPGLCATVPLGSGGRAIVYHHFAAPDGLAATAETILHHGDAFVATECTYDVAVSPAAALLTVAITAA